MTAQPLIARPSLAHRTWSVTKLHLVNRMTYIGIPWMITAIAFVITALITGLVTMAGAREADDIGNATSWASLSPIWYLAVVAILAIAQTFPFALGFGVTRRDFYLGTSLLFVLISVVNAAGFATLGAIERATNGWGFGVEMYSSLFPDNAWIDDFVFFSAIQVFVMFVGAAIATIYMRWRAFGMVIFWALFVLFVIGLMWIVGITNQWSAVGAWVEAQTLHTAAAWSLIPSAVAGLVGFAILRRATPKN